jgi:hypothetical protein
MAATRVAAILVSEANNAESRNDAIPTSELLNSIPEFQKLQHRNESLPAMTCGDARIAQAKPNRHEPGSARAEDERSRNL